MCKAVRRFGVASVFSTRLRAQVCRRISSSLHVGKRSSTIPIYTSLRPDSYDSDADDDDDEESEAVVPQPLHERWTIGGPLVRARCSWVLLGFVFSAIN